MMAGPIIDKNLAKDKKKEAEIAFPSSDFEVVEQIIGLEYV